MISYSREAIIAELQRVAAIVGPIDQKRFETHSPMRVESVWRYFGSWVAAVEAAGVERLLRFAPRFALCPVCSAEFRVHFGAKVKKTCGRRECSRELMRRNEANRKGDAATRQAARGRARSAKPGNRCERCGHDGSESRLEWHHKDRNVYNNDPENIEIPCRDCHEAEHRSARDGPATPHRLRRRRRA